MKSLSKAYAVLLLLTASSLGASYLPLGPADLGVGLGIAALKALIVTWAFMRLGKAPSAHRFAAFVSVLFIVLLAGFSATDVATR